MKITIFGVVWTILLFYSFSRKKYDYSLFMLFLSGVLQCDSIVFLEEGAGIGVFLFTCIFVDMKILLSMVIKRKKTKINNIVFFMILLLLCILFSNYNNSISFSFSVVLNIAPLLIYIVTYFCLLQIADTVSVYSLDKIIKTIIYIVMAIGIIQFLLSMSILPNLGILKQIIYNESDVKESMYFTNPTSNNAKRLYSTFMEPSYCASFLSASFFYLFEKRASIKYSYFLIILCLIEILLSRSSTAYGCFFVCIIFYMISKKGKISQTFIYGIIFVGILTFIFTMIGFVDLDSIIFSKANTGSGHHRNFLNDKALNAFWTSTYIGHGYKSIRASSIIYSLLGELGILGLFIYILLSSNILLSSFVKKDNNIIAYVIWFFSVVVSQIISCPDIDFCLYWMALYILLFYNFCQRKEKNNEIFDNHCLLQ